MIIFVHMTFTLPYVVRPIAATIKIRLYTGKMYLRPNFKSDENAETIKIPMINNKYNIKFHYIKHQETKQIFSRFHSLSPA